MNQPNSRSPRHATNITRLLAWAATEIAEQNASLRDAAAASPELEALFATNANFGLGLRPAAASLPLGRRA